jgi:transposase-like protein
MKNCPECGAWADVLESRKRVEYHYRRYKCANNHRFTTREFLWVATSKADTLKRLNAALKSAVRMTPATA